MRALLAMLMIAVLLTAGGLAMGAEPAGAGSRADCAAPRSPLTAIVGAMDSEIAPIRAAIADPAEQVVGGMRFLRGRLHGRDVVVVRTGVGKVNAAMTTTLLLDHFAPSELLFTGIAGALDPTLEPGDLVIATSAVQHDVVEILADTVITFAPRDPRTGERSPLLLPADPRLCDLARLAARHVSFDPWVTSVTSAGTRPPRIVWGAIATGDAFIASTAKKAEIRSRLPACAVEMEGAAVAQVCHQWRTPWLVIRSISDSADERAPEEIEAFLEAAATNAARLVMGVVQLLGPGEEGALPVDDSGRD